MKNKPFRILMYSQSLANFGDSLYIIAVVTLIFNLTGSAVMAGFFPLVRVTAQGLSGIVAPLLLDRWRLTQLLWTFEIGQTCCFILLSFLVYSSPSHFFVSFILIIVFITSLMHGWALSVRNALIPQMVESVRLVNANSLLATSDQIVLMLGWTSGGILVVFLGVTKILICVTSLFFISAVFLFFIKNNFSEVLTYSNNKEVWRSIKEGWAELLRNPVIKTISIMEMITGFGGSIWAGSIILVFVKDILNKGENWWGYINAGSLVGTIIGGVIVYYSSKIIEKKVVFSLITSSVLVGLLLMLFAFSTNPWYCLIIIILIGPPLQLRSIVLKTVFQTNISKELLPKCFSALGTIIFITYGISVLLFGWLADQFGVQTVYFLTSFLFIISSLLPLTRKTTWKYHRKKEEKGECVDE
jgi:MFS family permease